MSDLLKCATCGAKLSRIAEIICGGCRAKFDAELSASMEARRAHRAGEALELSQIKVMFYPHQRVHVQPGGQHPSAAYWGRIVRYTRNGCFTVEETVTETTCDYHYTELS